MIGSSVVPGLPNRCVMPSSLSRARNAERPVMRFFMFPHGLYFCILTTGAGRIMTKLECMRQESRIMAALRDRLKHALSIIARLLLAAMPDHAGKTFQRH